MGLLQNSSGTILHMISWTQGNKQDLGHIEHCQMPHPRNAHSWRNHKNNDILGKQDFKGASLGNTRTGKLIQKYIQHLIDIWGSTFSH